MQRQQALMSDFGLSEHLLHQQERIGTNDKLSMAVGVRPLERGQKPPVPRRRCSWPHRLFGDFLDEGAVGAARFYRG